ncbi:MAG: chorismate synthase [Demequinaceae bacterium]|nr:chorismate synthase [Demequinaceae bacterium]
MLRWLTAGESHGPALVGILEGMPAGVEVTSDRIRSALGRRRLGHGRGSRMSFEQDEVRIVGGIRHGLTQGGPIAIEIGNTEWPKWEEAMSADPVELRTSEGARNEILSRPRPGHADLVGMTKYGFDDARPILERASARETATRVALGAVAQEFLRQAAGMEIVSHVVSVGRVSVPDDIRIPEPGDSASLDSSPIRCLDASTADLMVAEIDECQKDGDTLGGVVEVIAYGVPVGLGSHVHWDRRLDARLSGALMGIQAIKGVEIGDGFRSASRRGSVAHDEIEYGPNGGVHRRTNRAGGIEGGMSNGQPLRIRAAMKPISTVPHALDTIDTQNGEAAKAIHQRSDVCAVAPAAIVGEAMVALVLADALVEKFGGDSLPEVRANLQAYLESIPENLR